jgi:hypothetical protein
MPFYLLVSHCGGYFLLLSIGQRKDLRGSFSDLYRDFPIHFDSQRMTILTYLALEQETV